jgi:hypothetical protein
MSTRIVNQVVVGSTAVATKVVDSGEALVAPLAGANIACSLNCLGPIGKARVWRLLHWKGRYLVSSWFGRVGSKGTQRSC